MIFLLTVMSDWSRFCLITIMQLKVCNIISILEVDTKWLCLAKEGNELCKFLTMQVAGKNSDHQQGVNRFFSQASPWRIDATNGAWTQNVQLWEAPENRCRVHGDPSRKWQSTLQVLLLGMSSALYNFNVNVAGLSWTPAGLNRLLE